MPCKIITSIRTGEDIKSPSLNRKLTYGNSTEFAKKIEQDMQTPMIYYRLGNWVEARNKVINGTASYEDAFNGVTKGVNEEGEPAILFYNADTQYFNPGDKEVVDLTLEPDPNKAYHFPVYVAVNRIVREGLKETPDDYMIIKSLEGPFKYKVLGQHIIKAFRKEALYGTLEEGIEMYISDSKVKPEDLVKKLQDLGLIHKDPQARDGRYQVRRTREEINKNFDGEKLSRYYDYYAQNVESIKLLNQKLKDLYGVAPYDLREDLPFSRTSTVGINLAWPLFNKVTSKEVAMQGNMKVILDKLSERFGVKYEIIKESAIPSEIPYNEEPGFFYQGKVWLVEDKFGEETMLHEFTHPFITVLKAQNKALYNSLLNEVVSSDDPIMKSMIDEVDKIYEGYTEDQKNDEKIIKALTYISTGKIKPKRGLAEVIKRFLFFLKQVFRRMFSDKTELDLSELNMDTNLDTLSRLLYKGDDRFRIGEDVDTGFVLFNKVMYEEMNEIDHTQLVSKLQLGREILKRAAGRINSNKSYYEELKNNLKNERSGGTIIDSLLLENENLQEIEKNIDEKFNIAKGVANTLLGLDIVTKKIAFHSFEVLKNGGPYNQDKAKAIIYHSYTINEWAGYLDEFKREFRKNEEIGKILSSIEKSIKDFRENTMEILLEGSNEFFLDALQDLKEQAQKQFGDEIVRLQRLFDAGDKSVKNRLDEATRLFEKFNYTKETIKKYIEGRIGDTNVISYMFEAFAYSPNPIVQSFAYFVNKQFYIVEDVMQRENRLLADIISKAKKDHNINLSATQIGEKLTFKDAILSYKDNKLDAFQVLHFLNPYGGNWRYEYDIREEELRRLAKEGTESEYLKKKDEFLEFRRKYFHSYYTEAVYSVKDFWKKSPMHEEAHRQRNIITRQLSALQNGLSNWTDDEIAELKRLINELSYLSSEYDTMGVKKEGDELRIAEIIKEYYELSKGLYESKEIGGLWEAARNTALNYDNAENKNTEDNWYKKNTRIKVLPSYYDRRKNISNQIDAILQKYPEFVAKNGKVGDVWEEIIAITRSSRDSHGQPIGNQMSPQQIEKVKTLQEKIESIKDNFRAQGNTIDPGDREALAALFKEIADMQVRMPSEYYLDTINEVIARTGLDYIRDVDYTNADEFLNYAVMDSVLRTNPQFAEWFHKNHILKKGWDESGLPTVEYERIYTWNRILPNTQKFIDLLKQGKYREIYEIGSNPDEKKRFADIEITKER